MALMTILLRDRATRLEGISSLLWVCALLVAAAPSVGNGFPLVFDDTNVYVSQLRDQWEGTPPFYSIFVFFIAALMTLFAVPVVQGICTLVTLELAFRSLVPSASTVTRAAGSLAVVALTQVPWLVSWIMPDLFGGLGVVAVVALLLARTKQPVWQRALLSLMALFSALVATANVLILSCIAVLCLLIRSVYLRSQTSSRLILGFVIFVGAAFALPIAWNTVRFNAPRLNVAAGAMLVSKLVDAGIAQRYLDENCPEIRHSICAYRSELPHAPYSQSFLWGGDSPLSGRLNAWRDPDGSFSKLASDIIQQNPAQVLELVLDDILRLSTHLTLGFNAGLTVFDAGELRPFLGNREVRVRVERYHGHTLNAYDDARQQAGDLEALYPTAFYQVATVVSYAALIVMIIFGVKRKDRYLSAVAVVFLAAVLLGIAVHGGLVGPYARYHVKMSWLAGFALAVWALRAISAEAVEA